MRSINSGIRNIKFCFSDLIPVVKKNNTKKVNYVQNLFFVGKPSAGKSTFFNAATHQTTAKIGAHPFTTIEPNIGQALYTIACPCFHWNRRCDAEYGHSALGERLVPVLLKDVAGLVPGACEGRGRGNKFLNDLLDADVLIHVVDLSGHSDQDGKPTTGSYGIIIIMVLEAVTVTTFGKSSITLILLQNEVFTSRIPT